MTRSFVNVIQQIMKKCKVGSGTKVAIVSPHVYSREYVQQFVDAAVELGAYSVRMAVPPSEKDGRLVSAGLVNPYVSEVLKTAEIVFDVGTPGLPGPVPLYSDEFNEVLAAGTRWLSFALDNPEVNVRRLYPTDELYRRTWAGAKRMAEAKSIRVISKTGTNLTMTKEGRKGHKQCGVSDYPGMWDNYGFGLVACAPIEETVEGTLVISPGDYILGLGIDVADPVKITFRNGIVREIIGDGRSSTLFRHWFETHDENAKRTAHIGWGTHENAVWRDSRLWSGAADAESLLGLFQIAVGINIFNTPHPNSGLGGMNRSDGHCDIDCLYHDFYLDDEKICENGRIVHPNLK